jgi:hypothetical protein
MGGHKIPFVLAFSILMFSGAFAADPKTIITYEYVCWGEGFLDVGCSDLGNPYQGKPAWRHFPCGTGGSSGFNGDVVCKVLCGKLPPKARHTGSTSGGVQGCGISRGPRGSVGVCGFRWAAVTCGLGPSHLCSPPNTTT